MYILVMYTEWDLVDGDIGILSLSHNLDIHCKLATLRCVNVSHITNLQCLELKCGCLGSGAISQ